MPMGLFPIAGLLKEKGFDVEIIHLDLEAGQSIHHILDFDCLDAVGMDLHWISQSAAVLDTAALLKSIKPDLFIFLGGFSASFFAPDILRDYPCIDAVVRGDGEVPALELCRLLAGDGDRPGGFGGIPNLAWRDPQNNVELNPISYVAEAGDMERLDFASADLLRSREFYGNLARYWTQFQPIKSQPLFFLEVGRGCSYSCLICGGNAQAQSCMNNRKGQVVRSIDSVMDTFNKALSFGFRCFFSCFQYEGSDSWYIDLFRRMKRESQEISYGYESWGLPSKELIDALSENFPHAIVTISPDSGNPELRRRNKDPRLFYDNRQLEDILEHTGSKGNVFVQLYFGYFLAGDTWESVLTTLNNMAEYLSRYGHFTEIGYLNVSADPGSSIYRDPEKYNIRLQANKLADYVNLAASSGTAMYHPVQIQTARAVKITELIRIVNALFSFVREPLADYLKKLPSASALVDYLTTLDLSSSPNREYSREDAEHILRGFKESQRVEELADAEIPFESDSFDQEFDFD